MKLSHIRYFVAVYEEGSFTAAARRENATQSGLSMQIKELESLLATRLFERLPSGVVPTVIGKRFYEHAIRLLRQVSDIRQDIAQLNSVLTGDINIGLMPTFTRAVLAPALMRFTREHPQVNVRITEAYSGVLERAVGDEELDFALVPPGHTQPSVRSSHLATDREFLVTSLDSDRENLSPVQLGPDSPPLRLILPGSINARRGRIESYVQGCGARIDAIIEMDAMMGTLELIAQSDWSAIVPGVLCAPDRDGRVRKVHPLVKPEFEVSYFVIEPAKRSMTPAARLFAEGLAAEIKRLVAEAAT